MMTSVLIIDDSPTETQAFSAVLREQGIDVLTAANGADGVALAKKEQPDLVLMDIVMPGLNGFQATRQLSKDKLTANIPVIIVSTKGQETDRIWGQRQGAKGYLVKPIKKGLLLSTIDQVLNA
jgi:twitching motility two-component system response regulator PilH